ncbi:MAG TPA: TonB-dependent receptor [Terriglobia bacterium]|nr:TonB-dependent receptor [Terriglobia bacterium]
MTNWRLGRFLAGASVLMMLAASRPCFSQVITGDILGTVQDSTGAVVPGAKITLTAVDTGIKLEGTSDESGNYLFAQLKPGHYSLQVSKEGFQTQTISDIELLVAQRPRVDVTLQVGQVTQTVEVSAGGVQLLETQTSAMGQVVQEKPIVELPLNGRNFMQLTLISAGVAPVGTGTSPATTWVGQSDITASVAGLRESNESFLVDGIESRNARFGSVGLRPSVDAIQEFKMQTSNFSAEFGRSSAIINTTIKSGTNSLHGTAFEFLRNSSLDANDFFFNKSGTPIPPFKQNNFGFSLGGPVVLPKVYHGQDKTFFFINYEGLRSRRGLTGEALVPTRAQLAGNLADDSAGTGILPTDSPFCTSNPSSVKCVNVIDPTTGQPFPGNIIPTNRISPFVQKWAQFVPTPNVGGLAGTVATFNYTASPVERNDMNQGNARLDHSLTSKDQLFGSFSFEDRPHIVPSAMPLAGVSYPLRNQLLALTETHIFSPTVVNVARFGYNRSKTFLVSQGALGPNYAKDVFGFQNTSANPFDFGVPQAGITNFSTIGSFSESIGALDEDYQFVDNLSIVRGGHSLKLGLNLIHEKFFQITDFGGIPSVSFNGRYTGAALGDFLLGDPYQATSSVGDSHQRLRSNWWSGYVQDDWRVKPNLTLNLGLRYEYAQTPYDIENRTQWFDPAIGTTVNSFRGGVRNGIVDPDWNNFAPRVGFAYTPSFSRNTVIRGSFGIFYATDNWNELQFLVIGPDFFVSRTLNSDPTRPTINLADLFPPVTLGSAANSNPFTIDKRNRTAYVQEWNFDIQHTFAKDWLFSVGYMGNTGQKLLQRRNENVPTFDPTGTISIKDREPWPQYSWILETYGGGWSSYNALTTQVEKRFSAGMYLLASYTWSHALDLGSTDDFSAASQDFKVYDRGNSSFDVRQRFVISYLYELPFGRGKRFLSGISGPLDRLVSGWNFNGITTFSTGQWKTPTLPYDWPNLGAFSQSRPDQIGNPYPANQTYQNWLTASAYVAPGCPSLVTNYPYCADGVTLGKHVEGNAGRTSLEMPGINNWDFAIIKNTAITEKLNLQFRAEFFNGWNHTQFGDANTSLGTTFGTISGLRINPREIQFAMKFLW